jgi:hypothetical protein
MIKNNIYIAFFWILKPYEYLKSLFAACKYVGYCFTVIEGVVARTKHNITNVAKSNGFPTQ